MFPRIDGMHNEDVEFHGHDIFKIDGIGNKTIRASNGQDLIIHKKIDGSGTHKLIGFGFVEVREKIDGGGDRWFIDCGRVVINDRKDGIGNLYLVNSPCNIAKKSGSGNVVWCGVPPTIESKGVLNMGDVIEDVSLMSVSEGQGRVKVDKDIVKGPGALSHQDEQSTPGKVQLDLGAHHLGSGSEFERKIRIDQGPVGGGGQGEGGLGTRRDDSMSRREEPSGGSQRVIGDLQQMTGQRGNEGRGRSDDFDTRQFGTSQPHQDRMDVGDISERRQESSGGSEGSRQLGDRDSTAQGDKQVHDSSDMRDVPFGFQKSKGSGSPTMGDKLGGAADRVKGGFEKMTGQHQDTRKHDDLGAGSRDDRGSGVRVPHDDKSQVRDSSDLKDVPFGYQKNEVDRQKEEDRQGATSKEFDRRTLGTEERGQQDQSADRGRDRHQQDRGDLKTEEGHHQDQGKALGFDQGKNQPDLSNRDSGGVERGNDRGRNLGDRGLEDQGHGQRQFGQGKEGDRDRDRNDESQGQGHGQGQSGQGKRGDHDRDRSHEGQSHEQGGQFGQDKGGDRKEQGHGQGQFGQGKGGDRDRDRNDEGQEHRQGQFSQGKGGDRERDRSDEGHGHEQGQFGQGKGGDRDRDRSDKEQGSGQGNLGQNKGDDRDRDRGHEDQGHKQGQFGQGKGGDRDRDTSLQGQSMGGSKQGEQRMGAIDRDRDKGREDLSQHGFHDDKSQQGRDDLDLGGTDTRKGQGDDKHNDKECEAGVCKVHHPQQGEREGHDEPRLGKPPEEVHQKDDEKEGTGLMEKVTGLMNRLF